MDDTSRHCSVSEELEKFCPGLRSVKEHPPHRARGHDGLLFLDSTAPHAPMTRLEHRGCTHRRKVMHKILDNARCDALLILQSTRMKVHDSGQFADADNGCK
jgi:hypothetical protein